MTKFDNFTDEELKKLVSSSSSLKELVIKVGYSSASASAVSQAKKTLSERKIDFTFSINNTLYTDEEVFKENSFVSKSMLRRRYLRKTKDNYKCSICGLEPFWNGKPLVLTMDHINGNSQDNRLENLRWLCPNCDRQQPTFSRGIKKIKYHSNSETGSLEICPVCGGFKSLGSRVCWNCFNQNRSLYSTSSAQLKLDTEEFKNDYKKISQRELKKKYKTSSDSIKKIASDKGLKKDEKYRELKRMSNDELCSELTKYGSVTKLAKHLKVSEYALRNEIKIRNLVRFKDYCIAKDITLIKKYGLSAIDKNGVSISFKSIEEAQNYIYKLNKGYSFDNIPKKIREFLEKEKRIYGFIWRINMENLTQR